jgi:hypothetical protein
MRAKSTYCSGGYGRRECLRYEIEDQASWDCIAMSVPAKLLERAILVGFDTAGSLPDDCRIVIVARGRMGPGLLLFQAYGSYNPAVHPLDQIYHPPK